ncbi:MAG: CDP-alcohol phosphatidyltransferase family protein [Alphaproteobacteria bacterium]|nr:CDP-alcohol phosphatidyltransferase family protein [Alphaproteobacteria bacterium]
MPLPPTPKVQTPWLLKPQRYGLTLANGVTAIRLVLVPFIAAALLNQRFDDAFWLTLLAGASDAVDGFIARYFGHKSIVGAYLDPAADKILIITLFGLLTYADHLPLWLMVLVLARDASIVVGVAVFTRMRKSIVHIKPLFISKVTTFSQIVLLLATLADLAFTLDWGTLRQALVWTAAALTAASWAAYFAEALRATRAPGV